MKPTNYIVLVLLLFCSQSAAMRSQLVADNHFIIDVSHIKKEQIVAIRDRDTTGNKRLILLAQLDPCYSLICVKTGPKTKSLFCNLSFEHSCRFYRDLVSENYIRQNNDFIPVSEKYYDILWRIKNQQ